MKLNYKRTILVGFAFFLICAFWQAYDNTVPLILTNKFGMSQTWSGVIMALDNVLALFLLPLFGHISDKCTHPRGRRTPFIVVGTLIAAVALIALSFADNAQLKRLDKVSAIDDPAALTVIYNEQKDATLLSPSGESFILGHKFTEAEFTAIRSQTVTPEGKTVTDPAYTNYVVPARQACARDAAAANPGALVVFVALLLIILLSMATFRSPAVALMPDVTPKPLRSKGNAIINLMGAVGGVFTLLLIKVAVVRTELPDGAVASDYTYLFVGVAALMVVCAFVLWRTVNERACVAEMEAMDYGVDPSEETVTTTDADGKKKLHPAALRSLIFILCSVAFWFMGYNAVTSAFSKYATTVWGVSEGAAANCLLVATVGAIVSYWPVGQLSSKIGRKKMILCGVTLLAACFLVSGLMKEMTVLMYVGFALVGLAWASINVNSFPMVVELAQGSDTGKYTGYYYTFSMAAQTLTPILSGYLLEHVGYHTLFPYAAGMVALSFVTMCFVHHGDSKPAPKKGLEALDVDD